MATPSQSRFDPPGPGTWEQDPVHFPRPATRYWAEMHPEPFRRGVAEFTRYYGMLLDTMEMAYVNGIAYRKLVLVGDDQVPERFQRADEVWERKLWRDQLREWDEVAKPAAIKIHRELQAVDPEGLSDADMVTYLTKCRDHHSRMIYQHMRFTGAAMICVGDLLAHLGDWTGVPPAEVLSMMQGAAPVSAGASTQLEGLLAAFAGDADARQILESEGDPAEVLDQLRALDNDVGQRLGEYLDLVGYRLLDGFDISGRYALELPDALLRAIRLSVAGRDDSASDVDSRIVEIRDQVPEQHTGVIRRAARRSPPDVPDPRRARRLQRHLGVGHHAAGGALGRSTAGRTGRIDDPEHLIDAGFDEMCSMLSGAGGPSSEELAERLEYRTSHSAKDAPAVLGPAPTPPPDPSGLPPGVGRVMRATGVATGRAVRQLGGATRGEPAPRSGCQWRRLRGTGPADLRSDRVRPHRRGGRAGDRVDDRGLQHPAAAPGRHRDRQRGPALPFGNRGPRVRHSRSGRNP